MCSKKIFLFLFLIFLFYTQENFSIAQAQSCELITCGDYEELVDTGRRDSFECPIYECAPYEIICNVPVCDEERGEKLFNTEEYAPGGCKIYECVSCRDGGDYNLMYRCPNGEKIVDCTCNSNEWDCLEDPASACTSNKCLEAIGNLNDLEDTTRVNVIFAGLNYPSTDIFSELVQELINIEGDGSELNTGLLSEPPFRDYQDSFNIWYINETLPYNSDTFAESRRSLFSQCPVFEKKQEITLVKSNEINSYAILGSPAYGWAVIADKFSLDYARHVLLHEWGHSFGGLYDEYTTYGVNDWPPSAINCDLASSTSACSKWCSGSPLPVENLIQGICNDAQDSISCYNKKNEGIPCFWLGDHGVLGETGCINRVELCTSIEERETCSDSDGDGTFWNGNFCIWYWPEGNEPYYGTKCIPTSSGVNIGTDCIGDTICLQGCTLNNYYSSSERSKMRTASYPWNYINEQHLISLLEGLDEEAQSITEGPEIITYDDFNPDGEPLSGGIINLSGKVFVHEINDFSIVQEHIQSFEKIDSSENSSLDKEDTISKPKSNFIEKIIIWFKKFLRFQD
ncbi:MAG: M64 family metallopeptidase [Nanoarchaeota archaeon]|nr:M64 family metallopeptidase [Nanoarchaeota archaeon]